MAEPPFHLYFASPLPPLPPSARERPAETSQASQELENWCLPPATRLPMAMFGRRQSWLYFGLSISFRVNVHLLPQLRKVENRPRR